MNIDDLQVGELYTDPIIGVICITELKDYNQPRSYFGNRIGTFVQLIGTREYSLYEGKLESRSFRVATDEDIKEALVYQSTNFDLGNYSLSISENDVYITGDDCQVSLNKEEIRQLITILNKEINL
jgi:hypothetical protein